MTIDYSHCKTPALNDLLQDIKQNRTMTPARRQRYITYLVQADRAYHERAEVEKLHTEITDLEERLDVALTQAAEAETALQIANDRLSEAGYPEVKGGSPDAAAVDSDRSAPGRPPGSPQRDVDCADQPEPRAAVAADGAGSPRRRRRGA